MSEEQMPTETTAPAETDSAESQTQAIPAEAIEPSAEAAVENLSAEQPAEQTAEQTAEQPVQAAPARQGGQNQAQGKRGGRQQREGHKGGQRPPRQNQQNQQGQPNTQNQQAKPARSGQNNKQRNDQVAYRPDQVLQRMQSRPGVYRAYVHEAEALIYQIRLVGLGPALAVLLSQTEHKSKRRIYWDISKWVFKEQRIKGKNVRSLMESIVYGDPRFLLKATHSVVNFLEDLVRLSHEEAYQPQARSSQS